MPRRSTKPVRTEALPELLITEADQMSACLEAIAASPVVGFDTEFVGEDAYRPELCLIQVATEKQLIVIDPFAVRSLDGFWQLLLESTRTTVVHAGREDIRLCLFQAGRPPENVFDLQLAAGLVGLQFPIGYATLVQDLLGYRMTKGETLTDWRRRPLTPAQIRYAFDDVRFLLPAWKKLTDRLRRGKRTGWAAEEFDAAVRKATLDETATERWRRVKGIGGLDRRGLAIAREVYHWRDRFAERVNRPPRYLLRDDVLAEVARRVPSHRDELAALRGIPPREVEAILEAINRASALPPEQWPEPEPRDNDAANILMLASLLGVVLSDWCARNKVAANLVASASDLKAIVRSRVCGDQVPDIPLTRGWRGEVVLPELAAILDGTRAVRVENPQAAAPLEFLSVVMVEDPQVDVGKHPPPAEDKL